MLESRHSFFRIKF